MNASTPSRADTRSHRPGLWGGLAIGVFVVVVQSITITPPVTVRFVDAQSGAPLARLPVTAAWRLVATHLAGSLPSTALKVHHLETDRAGKVHIGLAVMLHAPNFPFSVNLRDASSLPILYVVEERHESRAIANDPFDPQRPAPLSVLSLQRTSIDGTTVHLSRAPLGDTRESRDAEHMRYLFLSEIWRVDELCRQRWLCQED